MAAKTVREKDIKRFETALYEEEMSKNTIEKYIRDVRKFQTFAYGKAITKKLTMAYKESLLENFKVHSVNSFLVSLNRFLEFMECYKEKVKAEKIQESIYAAEEKDLRREEYERLVKTAFKNGNERLAMIMQTICSTGIRVSELRYITVEAVQNGRALIRNKGKNREILIVKNMRKILLLYIEKHQIKRGSIFVTRNGKAVDRSNICKEMKKLCQEAKVDESKVFPHNLRHLFAKTFYNMNQDIAKLANILGHSSIDTTRIYIRETSREYARLLEKMQLVMVDRSKKYWEKIRKKGRTVFGLKS